MEKVSTRSSPEGNAQRSAEALTFAELFFNKQGKEKQTLSEMYHGQSTLIWNGSLYQTRERIAEFYNKNSPAIETNLQALDAQIMPRVGDIIDMITVIAGGTIKQGEQVSNFSRTFLLGPNAPNSSEYLIISDTMRTQPHATENRSDR